MQYSLIIYQTKEQFADRNDSARREANGAAFMQYIGAMQQAGILVTTLGIEPPATAATIRATSGTPHTTQGPYAEAKEQIGGLCVIDVPNHDTALAWAKRAPFDHCGAIEVRPTRVVSAA